MSQTLSLLFQDASFVAVDKPPGLLVIPGREPGRGPSIKELLEAQLGARVFTVHRLDRETSGVLLFALTAAAHRTLSMAFEAGQMGKHYQALVAHRFESERMIDRPLTPARRGRMRIAQASDSEQKSAQTFVRPIELFKDATFVEAIPKTGRTHQIRVHLLSEGCPLLVDSQYRQPEKLTVRELGGDSEQVALARTPLHCGRLEIPGLEGIPARTIAVGLPEDMARTLALLRRLQSSGDDGRLAGNRCH